VALPDYVRPVPKPSGRTYYYFEKFRRTSKQWPRVRIPGEPMSEAFAKMAAQLPRLDAVKDVGGDWSWAFLDVTDRRHPLPDPKDCDRFWSAVEKADAIGRSVQAGIRKTFSSLIIEFKEHEAYTKDISEATREQYDRYMETIKTAWGDDPVESLEATTIQNVLDKAFKGTPAAGRVFRSTLSRIISWGIPRGYRKDNPVDHTERRDSSGTYSPWTPQAFEVFFEHARADLHTAVYSGLFTGQRKVDVLKMVRPRDGASEMPVVAQKTSDRIPVQIHSEYRQIIDANPNGEEKATGKPPQVLLHLRADGQPWSYEGFKTAWGREMEKEVAGKKPLAILQEMRWTFHGLRKNAVCMLLEVGCSEDQVGAIVGMSSAMVRHYAKEVSKFRLARSAMKLLETGWESQRVHVLGAKKEGG
jgi:integrase